MCKVCPKFYQRNKKILTNYVYFYYLMLIFIKIIFFFYKFLKYIDNYLNFILFIKAFMICVMHKIFMNFEEFYVNNC